MIIHTYDGTKFLGGRAKVEQVPGLPGWCVTRKTRAGGFAIVALEAHGRGFPTEAEAKHARDVARDVEKTG